MSRLIDADKLKRKCQKVATEAWKMKIKASAEVIMNQFIDFIDEADTVDAVPVRHGRWETVEDWDGDEHYMCSVCGAEFVLIDGDPDDNDYLYCPHCGADMRKDGEQHV